MQRGSCVYSAPRFGAAAPNRSANVTARAHQRRIRPRTLSVALATDAPLNEPQRSLVAHKLTLYLLGGRSSESDAHTDLVRSLRLPTGGCRAQTRIANRQRIPCMITKERSGSQNSC